MHGSHSTTSRRIPIALTALIALVSALVALAVSDPDDTQAHRKGAHAHAAPAQSAATTTRKELALHDEIRRLWEDHVTWTRLAVISLTSDSPDTEATVGRLLRNQDDIGDALASFYGEAAGDAVSQELRKHILIAADLIAAARAGDADGVADAQSRWQANAHDIAAALHALNPRFWQVDDLEAMLGEHLRLTTDEAVARLQGDWAADVAAYDKIHAHALGMADTFTTGLVKQFPKRFR